jgi:hypothetical protein
MLTKQHSLTGDIEISIIAPELDNNISASHLNLTNGVVPGPSDSQKLGVTLGIPGKDLQAIVDQDSRLGTSRELSRKEQRSRTLERKKQSQFFGDKSFHSPALDRTLLQDENISGLPKVALQETFYIELEEVGTNSGETLSDNTIPHENIEIDLGDILEGVNDIALVGEIGGNANWNGGLSKIEDNPAPQRKSDRVLIYELELIEKQRKREIATNVFSWILWVLFATSLGCAAYYISLVIFDVVNNSEISTIEWSYFIFFGLVGPIVTGSAAIMVCCRCGLKKPQNTGPCHENLVI